MDVLLLQQKNIRVGRYNILSHERENKLFDSKPSIILIHGLGLSSTYMKPVAGYLAKKFNVYIPDFPGFGKSEKPKKTLNLNENVEFLYNYISKKGIQKVVLLGNSFGCQIAAQFAVRYKVLLHSMVLVGPTIDPHKRTFFSQAGAYIMDTFLEPSWQRKVAIKDYIHAGIVRLFKTIRIALKDEIEKKLPFIQAPTLIVRGEFDPFVSKSWAKRAINLMPNAVLVEVPKKGHTVNSNSPQLLAQETEKFVNKIH